jgi:hypothetical protein
MSPIFRFNIDGTPIDGVSPITDFTTQGGSDQNGETQGNIVVPIPQGWPNGTTYTYDPGAPPDGWNLLNRWWFPPSTSLPVSNDPPVSPAPTGEITPTVVGAAFNFTIRLEVRPAIPNFAPAGQLISIRTTMRPIPVPLRAGLVGLVRRLIAGKVATFFDEDRELKTMLNFGGDYQALLTNWIYDPADSSGATILAKLYQPLPDSVTRKTRVWISRELAPPVIDQARVQFTPDPPIAVYLRPPNRNLALTANDGASVDNATLTTLFSTGSNALIRPTDSVMEQWYTDDVNDTELNVDYADYRNFVFFSSATARLNAFVQKLRILESFDDVLTQTSASLSIPNALPITSSLVYESAKRLGEQRIDLVRSFDGYERFLYYSSAIPYSSSLTTEDAQDAFAYHVDATWPKLGDSVAPIASSSAWLTTQLKIAQDYDNGNANSLVNNIPAYLRDDSDAEDFTQFVHLIGHHFDSIKGHIDQMPNIWNRGNDPSTGLSKDIIWNVAKGFGVDMPNPNAIQNLVDYTIGDIQSVTASTYREVTAEIWKRFLHNQIFMMKTKGTKTSLRALMNTYGVLPTTIQIREGVIAGPANPTGSYEIYEEQTNALDIPSGSFVTLPWSSSLTPPNTFEIRFALGEQRTHVLLNDLNNWALTVNHTSGTFGYLSLVSGSTTTISSAVLPLYDNTFYSAMVRYNAGGMLLSVQQADGDAIHYSSKVNEVSAGVASVWNTSTVAYLGGSGSYFGIPFTGTVDEVRVWGETLSDSTFDLHVKHPGLYNGNLHTSARDSLWIRLSFNVSKNLGVSPFVDNDAPYARKAIAPSNLKQFSASLFPNEPLSPFSMTVLNRDVLRYTPSAGAGQYSSNKVVIADPPILQLDSNNVPILNPVRSIVSINDKAQKPSPDNTIGFYFSVTDAINDNIIRTFGNIDLQDYIGDPSDEDKEFYTDLAVLNDLYWTEYAYTFNVNRFIDFVRNLLDPMFRQARKLVPARAKLISGIVHEPHLLERTKLIETNPFAVQGGNVVRDASEEQNLEANFGSIAPTLPQTELEMVETALALIDNTEVVSENVSYDAMITTSDTIHPNAELDYLETMVYSAVTSPVAASYIVIDEFTNRIAYREELLARYRVSAEELLTPQQLNEFRNLMAFYQPPNAISVNRGTNTGVPDSPAFIDTILPLSDFGDLGATTFFNDPNGRILTEGKKMVRLNESILVARGNWVSGTNYSRNQYVTQSIATDLDGAVGNGKEYVCITTDSPFQSTVPPYLDTRNWTPMRYVPTPALVPKTALVVNSKVSIAPLGSAGTPAVGYQSYHYRFTRDRRRGIINHQYLGCLQSDSTTTDGKSVVEIKFSESDILTVRNPGDPIQPNSDTSGPILDVQ